MNGRSPCPKAAWPTVPASALPGARPVTLVLILCLMLAAATLPSVTAAQPAQAIETDQAIKTEQAAASVATAFRHTPPGPLRGAVGKELVIPVAQGGSAEGTYTVQAVLLSGPGKVLPNGPNGPDGPDVPEEMDVPRETDAADITVDGRTVRMVPRQPGAYVIEVRGMREGPIS
ncbi:hypothetical protein [Nitratidesulfovibrio sp. SRB-5]|uniref:hypothetical protein n=1 Tax=Nitratidesulfovibrio sp. SRB-5 TaxID=2872636 RepID=UPI001025F6A8|nr:hypothetical protein [Nitratidesulfovibrio sp. SRB-5]MBZ2170639.1 hypothetical protein [Nitratidesulfovibrio sp. SRB-5]RXF72883.1 hypothetical protein EKK70_17455 [Desulfovibrio sp. DS-1]